MGKRSLEREQFWRRQIARQEGSGVGVRAYCSRERLSEASFYGWRQELKGRDQRKGDPQPTTAARQARRPQQSQARAAFLPIAIAARREAPIEIVLPQEITVRVWPEVEQATLARVLAALGESGADRELSSC